MAAIPHLHDELESSPRIHVDTNYGTITGGRAENGAAVFLEVPYALPPLRFQDPKPLPPDFRYENKEYTRESTYAFQPTNDGQDKVGYGEPSENPLFLNIVCPPSFPTTQEKFPVKVYIHGGFLQFGSPHSLGSQAQYISAVRSEVWINIGYRLSAFGFLACDTPSVSGNFGFKDQWLALEWIKENVAAFGGDPENIQITGLSAGAHAVHQLLHRASHLPPGLKAPFHSAVLQSNSMVSDPKRPSDLRPQFAALCNALSIDATSPDALSALSTIPASPTPSASNTAPSAVLLDGDWLPISPSPMEWQHSGAFATALREKGVRSILVGDLTEEWYLYSIAHPISGAEDIAPNLRRYYPSGMVDELVKMYPKLGEEAKEEEVQRRFGEILSDSQVHLPVRMLVRDLHAAGFPVLRYEIRWVPERKEGYVTHGGDRALWAFREIAKNWLQRVHEEVEAVESADKPLRGPKSILVLTEDGGNTIEWAEDDKWDEKMRLVGAVGEKV
ncbi:Alpha/Beta hydrolase protein [Roridomyces roridus]|uniref:Carboxylic ester hydrolase n=1 Tax=Roridomyces roridus TaxID=1738132 RepID=A0AAD7BKJ8_9AGAR|nr:Alpha/Beta hydrolase protein [Roridomyces roridus]